MFTGLIQDIGVVRTVHRMREDMRVEIETGLNLDCVAIGASMACSGCCLTIVEKSKRTFSVDISAQTLKCTSLGKWDSGVCVNLEPSLRLGDELGGHFVFGHVDDVATVADIKEEGSSKRFTICAPVALLPFIAVRGSVALDGVSLTITQVTKTGFCVNVIPHTLEKTTLGQKRAGDVLNLEIDMLARYVARLGEQREAA